MTVQVHCPLARARTLLRRACGVALGPDADDFVRDRLTTLAATDLGATNGTGSHHDLVDRAVADPCGPVARQVVEALLNHDTRFFRDPDAFAAFGAELPSSLERPYRVWSAGCATGQEAYSIALCVRECAPHLWARLEIVASDVSTAALARARAGVYTRSEINRGLPARHLVSRFAECGPRWKIDPELCDRIWFERLELTAVWPARPAFDAIFLCHVLLWLDASERGPLLARTAQALRPGGRLFLGASEPVLELPSELKTDGTTRAHVLRRKENAA